MQCEDTPCLKACDRKAIVKRADGILRVDLDRCEHVGACETACPYGAIEKMRAVRAECLYCARCYAACPRETRPGAAL